MSKFAYSGQDEKRLVIALRKSAQRNWVHPYESRPIVLHRLVGGEFCGGQWWIENAVFACGQKSDRALTANAWVRKAKRCPECEAKS